MIEKEIVFVEFLHKPLQLSKCAMCFKIKPRYAITIGSGETDSRKLYCGAHALRTIFGWLSKMFKVEGD